MRPHLSFLILLAVAIVGGSSDVAAQSRAFVRSIVSDESYEIRVQTGPLSERGILESVARRRSMNPEQLDLRLVSRSESLTGTHLRYEQYVGGVPVAGSFLAVSLDSLRERAAVVDRILVVKGAVDPITRSNEDVTDTIGAGAILARSTVVVPSTEGLRPAHQLIVRGEDGIPYHYLIDAASGELLEHYSLAIHASGRVFKANPVDTLNDPALQDNDDSSSAVPESAYSDVVLPGLAPTGPLSGPNVRVIDTSAPFTRRAESSRPLSFLRSDPEFEEVMAYYQLDRSQRYLQSLGYTGARQILRNGISVDPHAEGGADNSHYVPSSVPGIGSTLYYGDGGVDDAEDPDILLHEYAHAILDSVAPGAFNGTSGSQARALGEALGDYWAFSSGFETATQSGRDPFCIADWDARCGSAPSTRCDYPAGADCLRRVDSSKVMKDYLSANTPGNEHGNGAIFSSALRQFYMSMVGRYGVAAGRRLADTIVIEGQFRLPPAPTFHLAARKLIEADQLLNGGANGVAICAAMTLREILGAADCDSSPKGELTLFQSSERDRMIPDSDPRGILLIKQIDDSRAIRKLLVQVEIAHPFRGDLRITLHAPDGSAITLQEPLFDGGSDIRTTYGLDGQLFDALAGKPARGEWRLEVVDTRPGDRGRVTGWSLLFQFQGDEPLLERARSSDQSLFLPVVARVRGAESTEFISSVRIFNSSRTSSANVTAWFTPSGADGAAAFSALRLVVSPLQIVVLDDIVGEWFRTAGIGSVEFRGDVSSLTVTNRTFNVSDGRTYGLLHVARPRGAAISRAGAPLHLVGLENSVSFRTNVGVSEVSGRTGTVRVAFFDRSGNELEHRDFPIAPFGHLQFGAFDGRQGRMLASFRGEVRVLEGEARVLTYATVIDNETGDPIWIDGTSEPPSGRAIRVTTAVHTDGLNGTKWRSDLWIFNRTVTSSSVRITFQPSSNAPAESRTLEVRGREILRIDDVVASLFGLDSATGQLTVTGSDSGGIFALSRTWTPSGAGTTGQLVPARSESESVGRGEGARQLQHIESSVSFRTNVGLAETAGNPATVRFVLYSSAGVELFRTDQRVAPNGHLQFNLSQAGAPAVSSGRISLEVVEGDGRVLGYATVIDQLSGDPMYVAGE
ncbi:MAG TPA: proprotein convertase P-domain-containing protein [Thermoanaerobaculia bacterium]|nr:proprotein convertase P-domain-containing protein [Thermoanaerobaculia bacterium]